MSLELIVAASLIVSGSVVDVSTERPGVEAGDLGTTIVTLQDDTHVTRFELPGDNQESVVVVGVPRMDIGSEWTVELVDGTRGWVPKGLGRGMQRLDHPPRWNVNSVTFRDEELPLVFRLVTPGSSALGLAETENALDASIDQWNAVGCSDFVFARGPTYDRDEIETGDSFVRWEEDVWDQDPAIAGVTGIFFNDVEGQFVATGATMIFNGVDWAWVSGRGNAYLPRPEVNIDSVVAHEMGHAAGLAHETDLVAATMFYAYLGGDWQGSTAGDDRRGLCELYGTGEDECAGDEDCTRLGPDHFCTDIDGIRVCDEPRDDVGDDCSVEYINCADFCILDRPQDGAGYCSVRCEAGDCPDGFACGLSEDARVPLEDDLAVCIPFDTADDEDDDEDDDGDGCAGCGGSAALLPVALIGWGPLRSRRRL